MKRKDLQGLRGFAIIAVVLFHFFPHLCPSGYLGVDLFFVLSGFLITMIMGKSDFGFKALLLFYFRRVKRIVPLYYLITCIIATGILMVLPFTFIVANADSFWKSLLFSSNIGKSNQLNYFAELDHPKNLFTHTWSLSVEMQYYLLVPFIYYTLTKTPSFLHVPLFYSICIFSLAYQWTSNKNTAFNSVFARIWQFTIGSIAYSKSSQSINKAPKNGNKIEDVSLLPINTKQLEYRVIDVEQILLTGFTVILIFLISFGQALDQSIFLRLVTTCLTGFIILRGSLVQSVLLTNRLIVYIGDISYSLYLVHWPICVCIENYYTGRLEVSIMGIILSFLLAIVLTEIYEKWYLQANYVIVGTLLLILGVMNIVVLRATAPSISQIERDYKILFNPNCDHGVDNSSLGWCNFTKGLNNKSSNTGLIIGNSYAANLGGLVWENCGQKMRKLKQYSTIACEPLLITRYVPRKCDEEFANFLQFVRDEKPDYLFLIARWIDLTLNANGTHDYALETAKKRMEEYSQIVRKKIFVLHGFPTPKDLFYETYSERYKWHKANARFDDLFDEKLNDKGSRLRLETLARKFPKMVLIDVEAPLIKNGSFRLADPSNGISYFTGDLHFSVYGTKAISPAFKRVCRKL